MQYVWQLFDQDGPPLGVQILDVAIVAYLAYRLLALVRGSRAWRIIGGIFIYLLVWYLSDQFGLKTLHYVLDKALVLGPVALVILLLPELRSAIEGFGRIGFWPERLRGGESAIRAQTIDEIADAAGGLAETRSGALIVIERSRSLPEVERTGITVDAEVSAHLLLALFHGTNPLHDGASLIRGNRIVAAACQLPLAETRLPGHMHLRHRAAVGVTEATDAVAVVVSEERGTLSMCVDSTVEEGLSQAELRRRLRELLLSAPRSRTMPWRRGNNAASMKSEEDERAAV